MKQGIILARKHGSGALQALGPAEPYHKAVAKFKKDFQSGAGSDERFEEVVLLPIESGVCKRVKFVTAKRAKEIADAQTKAVEAAAKAQKLADEVKKALADVSAARNKAEVLEKAADNASKIVSPDPDYKAHTTNLAKWADEARAELKKAEATLAAIEKSNKAEAEKRKLKAESKTPNESEKQ